MLRMEVANVEVFRQIDIRVNVTCKYLIFDRRAGSIFLNLD
jgi:hypothetical protein